MKILVDKELIVRTVDILAYEDRVYSLGDSVRTEIARELNKLLQDNPEQIDTSLEDEINEQVANNSWFNSSTGLPSDITDEDRAWADKEIEKIYSDKKLDEAIKAINTPETVWEPVDGHNLVNDDLYSPNHEIMTELTKHKEAILEILDLLVDSNCGRGWNRSTVTSTRIKSLKAKLVGKND